MIDHSQCDHPSTPGARAKCRRARANGQSTPTNGEKRATPKTLYFGKAHHDPNRERNRGTTPRDKHMQCHVCGVERIEFQGTDPLSGILLFVGERCSYRIEREPDFKAVP